MLLACTRTSFVTSNSYWERFGMSFGAERDACESALQQRHQSRIPIAHDEQYQEWHCDVILVVDRVVDGDREVAADQQLNPRHPTEAPAIGIGAHFILLGLDMIFRSTRELGRLSQ